MVTERPLLPIRFPTALAGGISGVKQLILLAIDIGDRMLAYPGV